MSLRFSQLAAPLRTSVIQLPEAAHSSQPLNLALSGASYLHDLGRLPRLRLGKSAVRAICLNRANNLHQKEFQHPRAEKMHVHAHPRPAVRRVVNRILAHIECRNHQNPRTKITNRHLPPFSKVSKALIWCNTCRSYHTPNFMFLLKKRSAFFPHAWLQLAFTRVWQNDWQLFELLAGPSENIEMPWLLAFACIVHLPCVTLYRLHFGWLMWPRATTPWQAPSPDLLLIWLRQKTSNCFRKGFAVYQAGAKEREINSTNRNLFS